MSAHEQTAGRQRPQRDRPPEWWQDGLRPALVHLERAARAAQAPGFEAKEHQHLRELAGLPWLVPYQTPRHFGPLDRGRWLATHLRRAITELYVELPLPVRDGPDGDLVVFLWYWASCGGETTAELARRCRRPQWVRPPLEGDVEQQVTARRGRGRWTSGGATGAARLQERMRRQLLSAVEPSSRLELDEVRVSYDLDQLRQRDPAAAHLLELGAFVAPEEALPVAFLETALNFLPPALVRVASRRGELTARVAELQRRALFLPGPVTEVRLAASVQAALRRELARPAQEAAASGLIRLLEELTPLEHSPQWAERWTPELLEHVLAAAEHAAQLEVTPEPAGWLLDQAALYLVYCGDLEEACDTAAQALVLLERAHGPVHAALVTPYQHYAYALLDADRPDRARAVADHALRLAKEVLGEQSVGYALVLNLQAELDRQDGQLDVSWERRSKALELLRRLPDAADRDIRTLQSDLGMTLSQLERHQEAADLFKACAEAGPDTPDYELFIYNYGIELGYLERWEKAYEALCRALAAAEAARSPRTHRLKVLDHLAQLTTEFLDLPEAAQAYREQAARLRAEESEDPDVT
jgi:tetratricopeptide (TPR) repeat protein